MTQPAKVQEPSMEEILASIRRIIADDEAKPPPRRLPSPRRAPASRRAAEAAAMTDIPPSRSRPHSRRRSAPRRPRRQRRRRHPRRGGCSNNQDDIDALLAGLDEATTEDGVRAGRSPTSPRCSNSPTTWRRCLTPPPSPPFRRSSRRTISNSPKLARAAQQPPPAFEPPPLREPPLPPPQPILSRSTVSAVEVRVQHARQHGAQQQCADAGGSGQGDAAADAEILARRQSAGPGRAHRQGRNRAGFARRARRAAAP